MAYKSRVSKSVMNNMIISREPTNIVNIAIKIPNTVNDANISTMFNTFCRENIDLFREKLIRRITFMVLRGAIQ